MQLVLRGYESQVVALGRERITIGRSPENDVVVNDPEVSRCHLAIEPLGDAHRIVDLESRNGTYLNGRLVQTTALEAEDRIAFGHHVATYTNDQAQPSDGPSPAWGPCEMTWSLASTVSTGLETTPRAAFDTRLFQALRLSNSSGDREIEAQQILLQVSLLGQTVCSQVDLYQLLELIVEELMVYTGSERGVLLRREDRQQLLRVVLERRAPGVTVAPVRELPLDQIHDALGEGATLKRFQVGERAYLCLPLCASMRFSSRERRAQGGPGKRPLGALLFEEPASVPDPDEWLLKAVATHAASALRHDRLQHLATTDCLTGLENRGVMQQVLAEEIQSGGPFVLIMLDIDHFKRINDTHGHAIGDEVLTRVARRLRRAVRQDDYVGRWGGEEFLVILPGETLTGALAVTRKLAHSISSRPIGELRVPVTASMGVALYPSHGKRAADLVDRADRALYMAKEAGRDRVCVFPVDGQGVAEESQRASG